MPARSPGARHRKGNATPKPRLIVGLALPTAAAMALILTAAGAAMATSPKTQSFIRAQSAFAAAAPRPAVIQPDVLRPNYVTASEPAQAIVRSDQALARAAAADRVSRSVARTKLVTEARVAKALAVKRAAQAHSWRLPITNPVETSGFGYRWGRLHAGKDFAVSTGTNLASMSSGTVDFAGVKGGYGNLVSIRYWDGTISYFGHMSSISVRTGERVAPGQVVGASGNTGHSTGPHLHLEIHPHGGPAVNPGPWLAEHNVTW